MTICQSIQARFADYLDGTVPGTEMQATAAHLESCKECAAEFSSWRNLQNLLASVGPVKPPSDLGLRLRVAVSQERAYTMRRRMDRWQMYWQNSMAPVLARGAAGLASAVILVGTVALMIGTVAAPPSVAAHEVVPDATSSPQFLYTVGGTDSRAAFHGTVLVQAEISSSGRVYDYNIVSGPHSRAVRAELDNMLLMSRFMPARSSGMPVPGRAILAFSGVSNPQ